MAPSLTAMAPGMFMPGPPAALSHYLMAAGGFYMPGGFSSFAPLPPLPPARAFVFTTSPSPAAFAPSQQPSINNQRLSVAYLLNQDEAHSDTTTSSSTSSTSTSAYVKQELPASPVCEESLRSPKRKASSDETRHKSQNAKAKRPRAASVTSVDSSLTPASSSRTTTSSSTPAPTAPMTFKGDLSLFPHLQLQLHREQLDPQQHTELVLKVWNRQQQVLKLQQLQQKKQELKAQRLQQQLQRRGGKEPRAAATASPGSPGVERPTSSTPGSPTSAASADVVSAALPTLDEILNGADAQVDEVSDEDDNSTDNKKDMKKNVALKKPRRRISAQQVAVLEQVFAVEPFPGPSTKKVIAKKLGMKERSITVWFQNKRARLKRIDGPGNNSGHNETEARGHLPQPRRRLRRQARHAARGPLRTARDPPASTRCT
jgi:hypothetical protein